MLADLSPPLLALALSFRMHPWLSCAVLSPRFSVLLRWLCAGLMFWWLYRLLGSRVMKGTKWVLALLQEDKN